MRVKDRNNIENNFLKRIKQSIKNLFRRNDANYHSNQRKFSVNLRSYYEEYPEFKVTGGEIRIECVNKTYKVLTTIGNVPKFETIIIPGQSQVMSYEEYEELKRIMNVVLSEEEKEQIRILWDNLDILYENSNGEYNDKIRNIQEEIAKLVSEIYPEIDKTVTLSEEELKKIFYEYGLMKQPPQKRRK